MNDILTPDGHEAEPLLIIESKYCDYHDAFWWECNCERTIWVEVRVYKKENDV